MKLDLHTHCFEATSFRAASVEIVGKIIDRIKARGLDGIAVTEHYDKTYGFQVKEIAEKHFPGQVIIIPGQEINVWPVQVVELYLADDVIFKFLAHPGYPGELTPNVLVGLHGIEIENQLHNWHINKPKVREVAEKYNLMLMHDSDAHDLNDIGVAYNEVTVEELIKKVKGIV